jgi:hypothetical protein
MGEKELEPLLGACKDSKIAKNIFGEKEIRTLFGSRDVIL